MELIDSHCHIHDEKFFSPEQQAEAYRLARQQKVAMLCVGTDQADSRRAVQFAAAHEGVWAIVGVHPHEAKHGAAEIGRLLSEQQPSLVGPSQAQFAKNDRQPSAERGVIVGIGEIGLDYYYNHSPADSQIAALEQQLQWAVDYGLPVSFHVRDAFADFWPVYDNFTGVKGVLHSFTDSQANVDKALERGLYIGVNGICTFTRVPEQQQMYANLPLDRILLETDAPFLTPTPFRGKMNMPSYVEEVAKYLATLYNVPYLEVATMTTTNAKRLFDIN